GKIQPFLAQQRQQHAPHSLNHAHAGAGKLSSETGDRLRYDLGHAQRADAEIYRAYSGSPCLRCFFLGLAQLRMSHAGAPEKGAPGRRRHEPARVAREELHVQLGLQAADALRDGRLRHAELARSGAYAPTLDDSEKVSNLGQAHGDSSPTIDTEAHILLARWRVLRNRALTPILPTRAPCTCLRRCRS